MKRKIEINGVKSAVDVVIPLRKRPLNDYSWKEIHEISKSGRAKGLFQVEKTKDITVNGKRYKAVILGFNHDDLADGSGKAGITFGLMECLDKKYPMNETGTNIGGWKNSEMRRFLSEDIFNSLEKDLKAVISSVIKVTNIGGDSFKIEKTTDKLFLFSISEIYRPVVYQRGRGNGCDVLGWMNCSLKPEGGQYSYFRKKSHVLKRINKSLCWWWLRSPCSNSRKYNLFFHVKGNGNSSGICADNEGGIVFGFAI